MSATQVAHVLFVRGARLVASQELTPLREAQINMVSPALHRSSRLPHPCHSITVDRHVSFLKAFREDNAA